MINWKVRIKNENFWLALIPALLLLIQAVAYVFGFSLDLSELGDKLLAAINAVEMPCCLPCSPSSAL